MLFGCRAAAVGLSLRDDTSRGGIVRAALCIGQDPPSEQQAMRASGVANHPAHMDTLLAARARIMRTAETGLPKLTTILRMLERHESVKYEPAGIRLRLPHVRWPS